MNKQIDVVGHAAFDYLFTVDEHPKNDGSSYIYNMEKHFGGGAANIALGIANLGIKSKLHTVAGLNFKRYENYLRKKKVNLCLYRSSKKTYCAYIYNANKKQKTYFFWGASEDMNKLKITPSEYLHIAPCLPSVALRMAKKAKFIAFEPGQDIKKYDCDTLTYLTEKSDIIFCNEKEFDQLQKINLPENNTIIITQGNKGSKIYNNIKIPSIPVKNIDSTGAGDAYKAGFWAAYLREYDIETCCKIATTVASFVVEKTGAQWTPTWITMMKRYSKYFK